VDETMTDGTPTPYDRPPIGPRRLVRSSEDRMIAGVCGGVAEYLGVDPTLVRIGAVLLTVAGGVGIVAYAAAWLLVPSDAGDDRLRPSSWQAIGIVVAAFVLLGWFDVWDDGPTVPFLLLAIGAVLVWGGRQDESATRPTAPVRVPPPTPVVEHTGPGRWSWSPRPTATAPAPAPRRDPRHAGRAVAVGLGGLLLAAGAISGAIGASGVIAPTVFLGLSLAGFGVLIATGSFWGWSRPLAWGAMAVVFALAVASVIDVPLNGGVGDRVLRPATIAELPAEEHLSVGDLTIDLTGLAMVGDERQVQATVGIGELHVYVPDGVTVEVRAEAGVGQVDVFERSDDGMQAEVNGTFDGTGRGRVELDLEVGIGHVEVLRG
jgi:phage shock protein PspC (stress-responsive transcriptional regulator)